MTKNPTKPQPICLLSKHFRKLIFTLPTVAKCPLLNAIRAAGTYLSNGPGNTGTACTGSGSSAPRARTRIWGAGTWLMLCNPSSAISQTVLHSQETWQRLLRASGLKGQSTVGHWWWFWSFPAPKEENQHRKCNSLQGPTCSTQVLLMPKSWPTKPMPNSKSLQSSLQLQELLWELLLGFFFLNTKTRFYSVLGFFWLWHYSVSPLTQRPQDLLCTGLGENPCGLQPKLFLSKVYKVTSSSSFWTWIIFLLSCFPLFWFLQIRKRPYSEITDKLCTSNFLCRLLRQFLNVHMELKQNISEQPISYSTIKCSWLPAGNSCVLQYWDFRIHWEKLCLEKTMRLGKNNEVLLVTNNAGIK